MKSLKYEDTRRVLDFILNYAEINSFQLPGRTPKQWKTDNIKLLPTNVTKKTVYEEYQTSCAVSSYRCVKLRTFRKLWQQLCPHIRTMMPASDLCWTCQSATYKIQNAANRDIEKREVLDQLREHHELVNQEREHFQNILRKTKQHVIDNPAPTENHVSFDFAQQVHYPCDPLQPGPIFFKTPRKCGLFGVNSEPVGIQVNYLIDEAHACGKGGNTVISYLHHYFESHGLKVDNLHLHADNCSGQNKNSFVIWYLLWRCITGLNKTITLSFLIAGHTKFSPDAGFGLVKKEFRKTSVNCLNDIVNVVNASSKMNVAQLVGSENGDSEVPVYKWDKFLGQFFRKVKNILSYQHFHFDHTGSFQLQEHCKSTLVTQPILRMQPHGFPDTLVPAGLSLQRQWYLFKEIRQFVQGEQNKNNVCPKPTELCEAAQESSDEEDVAPPPKSRRKL